VDPVPLSQALEEEYASLGRDLHPGPAPAPSDEGARLRDLRRRIHSSSVPLSALCISGGGIRSATFALGALQELARRGLLPHFDYLSTVSGGGYIGSWLTAWIHRAQGLAGVVPRLAQSRPAADEPAGAVDPVAHLREFNNYLTPRLGAASPDTWTLVAIIVRNLLLNWLVLLPLLMAALMVPRILVSFLQVSPPYQPPPFSGFAMVEAATLLLAAVLYAIAAYHTMASLPSLAQRPLGQGDFLRGALATLLGAAALTVVAFWWFWDDLGAKPTFLQITVASLVVSGLGWVAYAAWSGRTHGGRRSARQVFGPGALITAILGLCSGAAVSLVAHQVFAHAQQRHGLSLYATLALPMILGGMVLGNALATGLTSRMLGDQDRESMARGNAYVLLFLFGWLAVSAIVLVVPRLLFGRPWLHGTLTSIGVLAGWITAMRSGAPARAAASGGGPAAALRIAQKLALPAFVVVLMIALSVLTNWILSVTGLVSVPWTDHRALVHASQPHATVGLTAALVLLALVMGHYINVNTFSLHGMYRNRLVRAYLAASKPPASGATWFTGFDGANDIPMHELRGQRPLHVLNLTLNLVTSRRLAWQQRKAESFTVTPLHAGSMDLGYRDAASYGGKGGISLGTAMTISGAAASPNMGYHSSPLVGFTMMLLNARLGSWLGNPGRAGAHTWRRDGPASAVSSVVREMLGLTDDTSGYVYLSDGGHFENLALYEMVLRRCRTIVVLDGGCDGDFTYEDLGNALRKIRIDLQVPIEFDDAMIKPLRDRKRRCAVAAIRYSAVDDTAADGRLVYVKPVLMGDEPPDVLSYAARCAAFPHEGTDNQWFNEAQTESYRALGQHTVEEMCRGWRGGSLEDFASHVAASYLGHGTERQPRAV
jgi:hypothetical protein